MSLLAKVLAKFRAPAMRIGEMEVAPEEELILAGIPREQWPFELSYMRTAGNLKWDNHTKIRNRKLFAAGWNAAVYTRSKFYVLSDQELEKIEKLNAQAKGKK